MKEKTKKLIRKAGLVGLIVFDIGALITAWVEWQKTDLNGPFYWFWALVAINVVIIVSEIISAVITGKTISTNFKYWAQDRGWKAYLFLGFFIAAILSLLIHLAPA